MLSVLLFSFALYVFHTAAGPACSARQKGSQDCPSNCASRWGWQGHSFGSDRWGTVLNVNFNSTDLKIIVDGACGLNQASSSSDGNSSASGIPIVNPAYAFSTQPPQTSPTILTLSSSAGISSSFSGISSGLVLSSSWSFSHPTALSSVPSSRFPSHSTTQDAETTTSHHEPAVSPTRTAEQQFTTSATHNSPSAPAAPSEPAATPFVSGNIGEYLSAHNTVRAEHGAQPLSWNDTLAAKAQQWADRCVFQHSGGSLGPFGENLAAGTGSGYGIEQAVKSWTDEVSQYNPSSPDPSHFTQVVWKSSNQLGCALQECSGIFAASFGLAKYVVCEYFPQGNVIGEFSWVMIGLNA